MFLQWSFTRQTRRSRGKRRPAASQEPSETRGHGGGGAPRNEFSTRSDETRRVPLCVREEDGEESDGKSSDEEVKQFISSRV